MNSRKCSFLVLSVNTSLSSGVVAVVELMCSNTVVGCEWSACTGRCTAVVVYLGGQWGVRTAVIVLFMQVNILYFIAAKNIHEIF